MILSLRAAFLRVSLAVFLAGLCSSFSQANAVDPSQALCLQILSNKDVVTKEQLAITMQMAPENVVIAQIANQLTKRAKILNSRAFLGVALDAVEYRSSNKVNREKDDYKAKEIRKYLRDLQLNRNTYEQAIHWISEDIWKQVKIDFLNASETVPA